MSIDAQARQTAAQALAVVQGSTTQIDAALALVSSATPNFVGPTQPTISGAYIWFDTSGGIMTIWIEDGL